MCAGTCFVMAGFDVRCLVIDGLASRFSVLEPAQGPRATVRMRTHDPR